MTSAIASELATRELARRRAVLALDFLGSLLTRYAFTPRNEADLQGQLAAVLKTAGIEADREVIAARGRYDLLVRVAGACVVLELKVTGSAPAVERQAQRYALTDGIDAVAVVTTSNRLASELVRAEGETLGGKPFAVIVLRGF